MSNNSDFMSKLSEAFSKHAEELIFFSEEALIMSTETKNSSEGIFWANLSEKLKKGAFTAVESNYTTMKMMEVLAGVKNNLH